MESQSLYSASFGLENGSGGGEYDFQRQQLEAFTLGGTPWWINDFGEQVFIT